MKSVEETMQQSASINESFAERFAKSYPTKFTQAEEDEFMVLFRTVCTLQKPGDRTPEELVAMVDGYLWILGDYPIKHVLEALKIYITENEDIPAPANIIAIMKRFT